MTKYKLNVKSPIFALLMIFLLVTLILLVGCTAQDSPLVNASQRFVDTVGSEYLTYVDNDKEKTPEEKALRHTTVEVFNSAIQAAKGGH